MVRQLKQGYVNMYTYVPNNYIEVIMIYIHETDIWNYSYSRIYIYMCFVYMKQFIKGIAIFA